MNHDFVITSVGSMNTRKAYTWLFVNNMIKNESDLFSCLLLIIWMHLSLIAEVELDNILPSLDITLGIWHQVFIELKKRNAPLFFCILTYTSMPSIFDNLSCECKIPLTWVSTVVQVSYQVGYNIGNMIHYSCCVRNKCAFSLLHNCILCIW